MFRKSVSEKDRALAVLPRKIRNFVKSIEGYDTLTEIVIDLGRPAVARFYQDGQAYTPELQPNHTVTKRDINHVMRRVSKVYDNNRAGIYGTLHRVAALRDRSGAVTGVTIRIARHIEDVLVTIQDIIAEGKSILLVGPPGTGKTSKLRSACHLLANTYDKRVMIVDTSNEIAGDLESPHFSVGMSRRIMVPRKEKQADVMIEAIENHTPEVIVIDEISLEQEARAALTCAERGVQLLATVHGNNLDSLLYNFPVNILLGGIETVTLSDMESKRRGTSKTVPERKVKAVFDVLVELQDFDQVAIYHKLEECVDAKLRGQKVLPEIRRGDKNGGYLSIQKFDIKEPTAPKDTENERHTNSRHDEMYQEKNQYGRRTDTEASRKGRNNKRRR